MWLWPDFLAWQRKNWSLMSVNRGPDDDTLPDRPRWLKCSTCHEYGRCYRAGLLEVIEKDGVTLERYRWMCRTCVFVAVQTAIALSE